MSIGMELVDSFIQWMSGYVRFHSKLGMWVINSANQVRRMILTNEVDSGKLLPLHYLAVRDRKSDICRTHSLQQNSSPRPESIPVVVVLEAVKVGAFPNLLLDSERGRNLNGLCLYLW